MTRVLLFKVIALILIVLYAFGADTPLVNLGWLGLAFFVASFI